MVGCHLRAQVAESFIGRSYIGQDQIFHILINFACVVEADRGHSQTFTINVGDRPITAGCRTADIWPVGSDTGPAQNGSLVERRGDHIDIWKMGSTKVWIVVDKHIALSRVVFKLLDDCPNGVGH